MARRTGIVALALSPLLCPHLPGAAASPVDEADARELEAREIEQVLIAPCCWTQPVSDHYSPAANEIRVEVRAMLARGMSRDQVLDAYIARHGKRILAKPRPQGATVLLYVLPWVFLVAGAAVVLRFLRRARAAPATPRPAPPPDPELVKRIEGELYGGGPAR